MGDWNREPEDEECAGPRFVQSAQSGNVTPLHCPGEGEKGADYELCSNCVHSDDAGRVQERKNEVQV